MKITRHLGMLLLAIWPLLTGLIALFNLSFNGLELIMALLALLAGAVILLQAFNLLNALKIATGNRRSLGMILLGIWLVLTGLVDLVDFSVGGLGVIMGLLALLAGALILLGR
jgi:hypothetical protein